METQDTEIFGVKFRMMRRPRAALVWLLRMGRVHGGELFGYVSGFDRDHPEIRVFQRFTAWTRTPEALDALRDQGCRFHSHHAEAEAREAVVGDER